MAAYAGIAVQAEIDALVLQPQPFHSLAVDPPGRHELHFAAAVAADP